MLKLARVLLIILSVATPVSAQVESATYGDFLLLTKQDPITDATGYMLVTLETVRETATLQFTCNATGDFGVGVGFRAPVDIGHGPQRVIQRFDKEEPAWMEWISGPDLLSVEGGDQADKAVLFAGKAMGASQVVLRLLDDSEDAHTYTFSLMGVTEGLSHMPCFDPLKLVG